MRGAALSLLLAGATRAVVLPGAMQLQDLLGDGLALCPVLPAAAAPVWCLRLGGSVQLRNDWLSLDTWNRYAGRRLDEADKHALLDEMGPELAVTGGARLPLLEALWPLGGGRRAGLQLENVAAGAQRLDLSLLETVFFGNDPTQALVVRRASLSAEALTRLRLAFSAPLSLPAAWTWLGPQPLEGAAALIVERGEAWTRTHSFNGRVEPPQGQVEATFHHVQERAGLGSGLGLDLGLRQERRLAGGPLTLSVALRGLLHRQTWRDARRVERDLRLPATPVGTTFDYDAFSAELVDTVLTRVIAPVRLKLRPGWLLGAQWSRGAWSHSLAAEQVPEDAAGAGRRRLSWAGTWRPGRSFHLTGQMAGGMGRGPALGAELGWGGSVWQMALGATGFAGLGNRSRGFQFGLESRWTLR
jgi:hypothetical protein